MASDVVAGIRYYFGGVIGMVNIAAVTEAQSSVDKSSIRNLTAPIAIFLAGTEESLALIAAPAPNACLLGESLVAAASVAGMFLVVESLSPNKAELRNVNVEFVVVSVYRPG